MADSCEHGSDCVTVRLTGELLASREGLCCMELLVIYRASNMCRHIQEESR